jgi:hypothetical protein
LSNTLDYLPGSEHLHATGSVCGYCLARTREGFHRDGVTSERAAGAERQLLHAGYQPVDRELLGGDGGVDGRDIARPRTQAGSDLPIHLSGRGSWRNLGPATVLQLFCIGQQPQVSWVSQLPTLARWKNVALDADEQLIVMGFDNETVFPRFKGRA